MDVKSVNLARVLKRKDWAREFNLVRTCMWLAFQNSVWGIIVLARTHQIKILDFTCNYGTTFDLSAHTQSIRSGRENTDRSRESMGNYHVGGSVQMHFFLFLSNPGGISSMSREGARRFIQFISIYVLLHNVCHHECLCVRRSGLLEWTCSKMEPNCLKYFR